MLPRGSFRDIPDDPHRVVSVSATRVSRLLPASPVMNDRTRKSCPGPVSRRDFLRIGTLGLGGLSLGEYLKVKAAAGPAFDDFYDRLVRLGFDQGDDVVARNVAKRFDLFFDGAAYAGQV